MRSIPAGCVLQGNYEGIYTLFFGDHFKDFEASKRAKTSFIFAEYGYHNNSIKDEDLNDVVKIKSLREILD